MADALSTLASTWEGGRSAKVKPFVLVKSQIPCYEEIRVMLVNSVEKPWFYDLQQYLEMG